MNRKGLKLLSGLLLAFSAAPVSISPAAAQGTWIPFYSKDWPMRGPSGELRFEVDVQSLVERGDITYYNWRMLMRGGGEDPYIGETIGGRINCADQTFYASKTGKWVSIAPSTDQVMRHILPVICN